jgi:hypothetical protein
MKSDNPSEHEDEGAETNGRRGIQSVGNAVRILEALAGLGEASPLRTVSQRAGLSTSQAHRYLASLIAAGMAQQTPGSGLYDLGPVAIKLGLAALPNTLSKPGGQSWFVRWDRLARRSCVGSPAPRPSSRRCGWARFCR